LFFYLADLADEADLKGKDLKRRLLSDLGSCSVKKISYVKVKKILLSEAREQFRIEELKSDLAQV
jgi:hypothetical protein